MKSLPLNELAYTMNRLKELQKISRSLTKLAEFECNYGNLSDRQQKREDNLKTKAKNIAAEIGYKVYYQGDPRGCALYLIDEVNVTKENYYSGIALS